MGNDTDLDRTPLAARLPLGALERMPKWLIIVPLAVQWIWLSLRFGGATVPSAANPGITAGGLVGEGKLEYFARMGPLARGVTASRRPASGFASSARRWTTRPCAPPWTAPPCTFP